MKLFRFKQFLMTPFISMAIKHPKLMRMWLFKKLMTKSPEKVSNKYDGMVEKSGLDYTEPLREVLKNLDGLFENALEVASGTGISTVVVASNFPDTSIICVDMSEQMNTLAKKKMEKHKINTVSFKQGDAMSLQFPDGLFDLVYTTNAPIYLDELSRVMKEGATLLLAFSFGKKAFSKNKVHIDKLLKSQGLDFDELVLTHAGASIIAHKPSRTQ